MWFVFSLLSSFFEELTSILAKVGINGVNSNLATALRSVVVVITIILAVIFLHEKLTIKSLIGCGLITIGTLFMVM